MALSYLPQAPRFPGAAAKVDSLVRNAVDDGPMQVQPKGLPPRSTQTPVQAAPGVPSNQDFPSLPTPQKPPETAAAPVPAPKKGSGAKTAAASVRPAIPKRAPSTVAKGVSQTEEKGAEGQDTDAASSKVPENTQTPSQKEDQNATTLKAKKASVGAASSDATVKPEAAPAVVNKRPKPGKIDVSAAQDVSKKDIDHTTPSLKSPKVAETDQSSPAQPATPTMVTSQQTNASPAPPTRAPKTLRVGTMAKEGHKSPSNTESSTNREASRQASANSVQPPATPSDNASFTSTSASRANSPPPSRVGTAPTRQTTKAQQKKERQARAKQAEETASKAEQQPVKAEETEVVQEPIIGRKKKSKKAKQSTTTESTPDPSRAPSPERLETVAKVVKTDSAHRTPPSSHKDKDVKSQQPVKTSGHPKMDDMPLNSAAVTDNESTDATPKRSTSGMTPAALFAHLTSTGALDPAVVEILFKPVPGVNTRFENTADLITAPHPILSDSQSRALDNGNAILVEPPITSSSNKPGSTEKTINARHTVILPDRRILGGLSAQQAKRMVELVNRLGVPAMKAEIEALVPVRRLPPSNSSAAALTRGHKSRFVEESEEEFDEFEDDEDDGFEDEGRELINRFADADVDVEGSERVGVMGGAGGYGFESTMTGGSAKVAGMGMGVGIGGTLSVEEAEARFLASKRETEVLEKKLNGLIKRNRKLMGV